MEQLYDEDMVKVIVLHTFLFRDGLPKVLLHVSTYMEYDENSHGNHNYYKI